MSTASERLHRRAKGSDPVRGSAPTEYTARRGVYTARFDTRACDHCRASFHPRVRNGSNRSRFCGQRCKDTWWNKRRIKARQKQQQATP